MSLNVDPTQTSTPPIDIPDILRTEPTSRENVQQAAKALERLIVRNRHHEGLGAAVASVLVRTLNDTAVRGH